MKSVLSPVLALLAMLVCIGSLAAQTPAPSPAGPLTKEQFDQLSTAIGDAVVARLKKDGVIAGGPASAPSVAPSAEAATPALPVDSAGRDETVYFSRLGAIAAAFPTLLSELGRVPGLLAGDPDGRGVVSWALLLAVAAGLALAVEPLLRGLLGRLRGRLAVEKQGWPGIASLLLLLGLDAVGLFALWVVSYGLVAAWFAGPGPQARLAAFILASLFSWRLYMVAFRFALRPALAGARLAEISDIDAKAIYRTVGAVILLILAIRVVLRILIAIKSPTDAIACGQVIAAILIVSAFIAAAIAQREAMARWLIGLSRHPEPHPMRAAIARHWLAAAIPFFLLLGLAQIHGAIAARFTVSAALTLTLNVIIGLLILESFLDRVSRLAGQRREAPADDRRGLVSEAVARCLRLAILIGTFVFLAETWIFDVLGLGDAGQVQGMARMVATVGGTLFVAYCAWEGVRFLTDRYVSTHRAAALPGQHDADDETLLPGASRLATLMPLMRVALIILICVLAVLTVLSQLGINVTALVAGASVVGLALSFGSQTLVKDIVSGIFYLVDDAFRVGEYIDCGKAKGTVEGFTLRSLRLRHQNGQVYTIPFGQLGQITNFSRDWTTMKFNLRFARDTDIEKLRKTVKRIGVEMLEDPEMKDEILVPLKMQGVTDIADNAIVIRFKFTVRPSKPTYVHREALKRMFRAFPEAGISFANAMVSVQTMGGPVDATAAGAAAAATMAAHARAEAEAIAAAGG